jgi:hypothetical protein
MSNKEIDVALMIMSSYSTSAGEELVTDLIKSVGC